MLNIYFGDMPEAIYNTAGFFKNTYQDKWIRDDISVRMLRRVTFRLTRIREPSLHIPNVNPKRHVEHRGYPLRLKHVAHAAVEHEYPVDVIKYRGRIQVKGR